MASIEIYNSDGRLQVSDEAIDITLEKITYFDDQGLKNNAQAHYERLYAIQPLDGKPAGATVYYLGNGELNFTGFVGKGKVFTFSYEYTAPPAITQGFEVYDQNGVVTFSSNLLSLNILDVVNIANANALGSGVNGVWFDKDYGTSDIAVIPISQGYWFEGSSYWTIGFKIIGNRLIGSRIEHLYLQGASSNSPIGAQACQFIVIKTTGY